MITDDRPPVSEDLPPPASSEPAPLGLRPAPDPTRSGARWVGGAGVALLLAAAAVLTAVSWDQIGQTAKLGGLVAITIALLIAGQRLRHAIPITAQTIFHLGALLVPFDMAAVAILAGWTWQPTLLLASACSAVSWYVFARLDDSAVLLWAARLAVVFTAAGLAAVTPLATPLVLAGAAAAALLAGKRVEASDWALLAGVLPVAAFFPWPARIAGSMVDLGFHPIDRWQLLAAGIVATGVLIAATQRWGQLGGAWSAVVTLSATVVTALSWFGAADSRIVAIGLAFVLFELLVLALRSDELWAPVLRAAAKAVELVAGYTTILLPVIAGFGRLGPWEIPMSALGMACVLTTVAWFIADARRVNEPSNWLGSLLLGTNWGPATGLIPLAGLSAALAFAAPSWAVALVGIGFAFWMVATWRSASLYGALGLVLAVSHPIAQTSPWTQLALGGLAAAVLAYASQLGTRRRSEVEALLGSLGAMAIWFFVAAGLVERSPWFLVASLVGAWALNWLIRAVGLRAAWPMQWIARTGALFLVIAGLGHEPELGLVLVGLGAAAVAFDHQLLRYLADTAVGRGENGFATELTGLRLAFGATLGVVGMPLGALLGFSPTVAGAAMTVAGLVLVGMALVAPRIAELPLAAAAVSTSVLGVALSFADPTMFALSLVTVGATLMLVALATRSLSAGVIGYAISGGGVWLQLVNWNIDWAEPYLVMPALAALVAGHAAHQRGFTSWMAYSPTVTVLTSVSLTSRIADGSAWHAVFAGAVGVVAVIAGGHQRLIGPLLTGSVALAAVAIYESLGPSSSVPTWAWLALGGTVLLGAALLLERADTSPLEQGQRLRHILATQFS